MQTEIMSTTVVTEKSTNFEKSQKSLKVNSDDLQPLKQEKVDEIINSIQQDTILVPIVDNSYCIGIDIYGNPYAYRVVPCPMTGNPLFLPDPTIIVQFDGINYYLYKEVIVCSDNNINNEYYSTGNDNANCSLPSNNNSNISTTCDNHSNNEDSTPRDDEIDINIMGSKLENLDLKCNKISDSKILDITILMVLLTLFKKSIVQNGNPNPDYLEIFNRIKDRVNMVLSNNLENINISNNDIKNFLLFILNRTIPDPSVVYMGNVDRPILNIKSIAEHFGLVIPKHPTFKDIGFVIPNELKSKVKPTHSIGLKFIHDGNYIFPFRDYGLTLIELIMSNLTNEDVFRSLSIIVFLWNELNGLQDFVDEVNRKF